MASVKCVKDERNARWEVRTLSIVKISVTFHGIINETKNLLGIRTGDSEITRVSG